MLSDLGAGHAEAVGGDADLGPGVLTIRCDELAGCAWPAMSRIARYHLLAAALPPGTARIVLRMPGAADPSLPRGSVAVETERGRVTADWAASLALARSRWVASLPEPRE